MPYVDQSKIAAALRLQGTLYGATERPGRSARATRSWCARADSGVSPKNLAARLRRGWLVRIALGRDPALSRRSRIQDFADRGDGTVYASDVDVVVRHHADREFLGRTA